MTVTRYDSIRAAESAIRALEANGTSSQRYVVLRAVERARWRFLWCGGHPLRLLAAAVRRPFRTYVVRDADGTVLCVAPLERQADGWSAVAGDLDFVALDYTDFLYADRPTEVLAAAAQALARRLTADGIRRVTWPYLADTSRTHTVFAAFPRAVAKETDNVAIALDRAGTWEDHLARLSANARHNLRRGTARAAADGLAVAFDVRSSCGLGEPLDTPSARRTLREARAVYLRRQAGRYAHAGIRAAFYFRHLNYISLSVPGDCGVLAVLRLGGRIAASLEGYANFHRGALEVPRVSMDDAFAAYGPGRLLVAECLKWMLSATGLSTLDLCRGGERYKYDLGGTCYRTRRMTCDFGGFAA